MSAVCLVVGAISSSVMKLSKIWPLKFCLVVLAQLASFCVPCSAPFLTCFISHCYEVENSAMHSATVFAASQDGRSSMLSCITARTST